MGGPARVIDSNPKERKLRNNNIQMPEQSNILDAALGVHARGWVPVPLKPGTKRPALGDWPETRYRDADAVKQAFSGEPYNLGVALGNASGGLVDIDLDHPKAPYAARFFLPSETMRTGRVGSPGSHYWFRVDDLDVTRETWQTPDRRMIVEARASGHQTALPPSVHPEGETYRWESEPWQEPKTMGQQELMARVACIALVTYLVEVWPERGGRHDAYLALAGALLREGPPDAPTVSPVWGQQGNAESIIRVLAEMTHDDDGSEVRVAETVPSTVRKIREGRKVQGFPTLAKMLGTDQAARLRDFVYRAERWYGHERKAYTGLEEPEPMPEPQTPADGADGPENESSAASGGIPEGYDAETFERMVTQEVARMYVRDAARLRYLEQTEPEVEWDVATIDEVLERDPEQPGRIDRLMPWEGTTTIIGQAKAGKTTLALNLFRSLLTGEKFLGEFSVRPVEPHRRVAMLSFEMTPAKVAEWCRKLGIPADRFVLVNLRAMGNPFRSEKNKTALAKMLKARDVETLLVDTFTKAFTGESQNDAGEVQTWLSEVGRWARQDAGVRDLILTAHAGHGEGKRARGSSALHDDPDAYWVFAKKTDGSGLRTLAANGRDVSLEEHVVTWDDQTLDMALGDPENAPASTGGVLTVPANPVTTDADVRDAMTAVMQDQGGQALSATRIRTQTADRIHQAGGRVTRNRVMAVLQAMVDDESLLNRGPGAGGGLSYVLADDVDDDDETSSPPTA